MQKAYMHNSNAVLQSEPLSEPTLIAGQMLENLGAGQVDLLPNFSSQPASDIVPLRFTSCQPRQRDDKLSGGKI